jgi:hypothetical protein
VSKRGLFFNLRAGSPQVEERNLAHAGIPNADKANSTENTNANPSANTPGVRIIKKVASPPQGDTAVAVEGLIYLIETVAAQMRSQGIILLGAQQQASKVSEKVIENASISVIGRSGSLELSQSIWRFLSKSNQRKAAELTLSEKILIQNNEPMHVLVPLPPWTMNPREATDNPVIDVDATTVEEDDDDDIATY